MVKIEMRASVSLLQRIQAAWILHIIQHGTRQSMRSSLRLSITTLRNPISFQATNRAIGLKWVYRIKNDPAGNIVKHKPALWIRDMLNTWGEFDDVFTLISQMEYVGLILALAMHIG
jgi:hypothetical protein